MSREKANPPLTIRSDKKGTVKLLQWESGGKTLVISRPPPKDDPEADWTEEKLNFKFDDQAEAMIEVLERDLNGEVGEKAQYKSEAKKYGGREQKTSKGSGPSQGFGRETPDHDDREERRPAGRARGRF